MEQVLAHMQEYFQNNLENGLLGLLVSALVIAAVAFVLLKLNKRLYKALLRRERANPTQLVLLRRIVKIVIIALAVACVLLQIKPFQSFVWSFLASSGIVVVVLGFAAQEAMGNLVSGIFISIFKPFKLNDRIKLPDKALEGYVEDISLRHTVIRTFENHRIVIPNSVMNTDMIENINFSDDKVCNYLDISVSYTADAQHAIQIVREEAEKHPACLDNRTEEERAAGGPKVQVRVVKLGEWSVDLRAYVWSADAGKGFAMLSDLRLAIKERFGQDGIELPYPYRNVILKREK